MIATTVTSPTDYIGADEVTHKTIQNDDRAEARVDLYCVLVFQLGRTVEPHPFSWQVAPACYAHCGARRSHAVIRTLTHDRGRHARFL